jgi:hypothetical protein
MALRVRGTAESRTTYVSQAPDPLPDQLLGVAATWGVPSPAVLAKLETLTLQEAWRTEIASVCC